MTTATKTKQANASAARTPEQIEDDVALSLYMQRSPEQLSAMIAQNEIELNAIRLMNAESRITELEAALIGAMSTLDTLEQNNESGSGNIRRAIASARAALAGKGQA